MAAAETYVGAERRFARPSPATVGLAVFGFGAIAFVTLCPIGLRPHVGSANAERFMAYLLLGAVVARAAGRRGFAAAVVVALAAVGLEAAQALIPGRHAAVADATVKALGGVIGCAAAQGVFAIRRLIARAAAQGDVEAQRREVA